MGIKTSALFRSLRLDSSEKPPLHMGIKTGCSSVSFNELTTLKNLPTTWGLRPHTSRTVNQTFNSEKPPHHMGIKTGYLSHLLQYFSL